MVLSLPQPRGLGRGTSSEGPRGRVRPTADRPRQGAGPAPTVRTPPAQRREGGGEGARSRQGVRTATKAQSEEAGCTQKATSGAGNGTGGAPGLPGNGVSEQCGPCRSGQPPHGKRFPELAEPAGDPGISASRSGSGKQTHVTILHDSPPPIHAED